MRLIGAGGLHATVTALPGYQPPRIRLTAGPFVFFVDLDEAVSISDRLIDAVEAIRTHANRKDA